MPRPKIRELEVKEVDPSKNNPRKHFDDGELNELASSIFEHGIIEPLVVRPKGKKFEIVAGERRYRANKIALARAENMAPPDPKKVAALQKLPCMVRELSDEAAAEIQLMENEQRSDLTPMERAAGYRNLINTNPTKHTATTIAQKVGKSAAWVWDIMKLLDLIPKAKELLDAEKMTVNHAIPIARLTPKQQEKVIDANSGGLFSYDVGFNFEAGDDEAEKKDPWRFVKARSVRELNSWIAHHIRFDAKKAAVAAPLLFEQVAEAVTTAEKLPGRGKKVIPITFDWHVHDDAKDGDERTYGTNSWRLADGSKGTTSDAYGKKALDSPTCDHSVLGLVVAGPNYGKAYQVCVAREKCEVHFGDVIKQKKKREQEKVAAGNGHAKTAKTAAPKEGTYERQERERREERQRAEAFYAVVHPPLKKAAMLKIDKLPAKLSPALMVLVCQAVGLPRDTKQADLAQAVVTHHVKAAFGRGGTYWLDVQKRWAEGLGVDVKKIHDDARATLKEKAKAAEVQTSGAASSNGSKPVRKATAKKTTVKRKAKLPARKRAQKK